MFFNSNHILIANQLRTQTLAKQRIRLLNTNRYQNFKYKFGTNGGENTVWDSIKEKFNEKLLLFVRLLREQSNVYMSLRLRRMAQICGLYNRIYSEATAKAMMSQMLARLRTRALNSIRNRLNPNKSKDSVKYLMSAVCGLFCWESQRITDQDMNQTVHDFEVIQRCGLNRNSHLSDNISKSTSFSVSAETQNKETEDKCLENESEWEEVITRDDFKLWRRSVPNSSLYEYKSIDLNNYLIDV